ncbi:MAG: hypothetical protein COB02_00385 [Candidatus Cloacimonadota bacterium]|nr:MAG: hypothetical protein COB02_00385 [Candidatus Cloacimonadota bacterium]
MLKTELYWLTMTTMMTGLLWMPYIVNRMLEVGVIKAMMDSNADTTPIADWGKRMMKAHSNAVENLVVFAPLVLVLSISGLSTALTAKAAMIYFFARLTHYLVYTAGVPVIRTITFIIGVVCQMIMALTILGVLK